MKAMPMLVQIVFAPSLVVAASSAFVLIVFAILGALEIKGLHLQYSKFFNVGGSPSPKRNRITVPSRVGMLLLYSPAFLAAVASFWLFPDGELRFLLLKSAIIIHFFKRILEVLFVHKYSGMMALGSMIIILVSYLSLVVSTIYFQLLCKGLSEPTIDLKYAGIVVFFIGISGNLYHHYLLSKIRSEKGAKDYKIPKGGLFGLVICPHYLFEILDFLGMSFISQSMYVFTVTLGSALYLMARSYVTKKWYLSKFEDFPKDVKVLIPFVF